MRLVVGRIMPLLLLTIVGILIFIIWLFNYISRKQYTKSKNDKYISTPIYNEKQQPIKYGANICPRCKLYLKGSCPYNSEYSISCNHFSLSNNSITTPKELIEESWRRCNYIRCPHCYTVAKYIGYGGERPHHQCVNNQCEHFGEIFT